MWGWTLYIFLHFLPPVYTLMQPVTNSHLLDRGDPADLYCIEEGFIQKRRQRSSLLFWGAESIEFLLRYSYFAAGGYEVKDEFIKLQFVLVKNSWHGKEFTKFNCFVKGTVSREFCSADLYLTV